MFRKIGLAFCGIFYKLIPSIYDVFYDISNASFFQEEAIRKLSNNIYILVSVAMLFTMGVQLLKAIVNPDLLLDNKKGTAAFFKRAFLSIVIITLVPIAFDALLELQNTILEKSIIEKVVTGYSGSQDELKVGQYIAGVSLSEMLYPVDGATMEEDADALAASYNSMINDNVKMYFDDMYDYIAVKNQTESSDEKYVLHFEFLACAITGFVLCYLLVVNCIDISLRMVKLSLLELIAPVSIVAYIIQGEKSLESWVKEVTKTYALIFVKIGALSFATYGIQQLSTFMNDKQDNPNAWIIKLLALMGLLMVVNELPNLIQSLFGVDFQWKGGIRGRLGQMKGVGSLAQKGWDGIRKGIGSGAKKAGLAAAGGLLTAGGAIGYLGGKYGKVGIDKLKGTKAGQAMGTATRNIGSAFKTKVGNSKVAGALGKAGNFVSGLNDKTNFTNNLSEGWHKSAGTTAQIGTVLGGIASGKDLKSIKKDLEESQAGKEAALAKKYAKENEWGEKLGVNYGAQAMTKLPVIRNGRVVKDAEGNTVYEDVKNGKFFYDEIKAAKGDNLAALKKSKADAVQYQHAETLQKLKEASTITSKYKGAEEKVINMLEHEATYGVDETVRKEANIALSQFKSSNDVNELFKNLSKVEDKLTLNYDDLVKETNKMTFSSGRLSKDYSDLLASYQINIEDCFHGETATTVTSGKLDSLVEQAKGTLDASIRTEDQKAAVDRYLATDDIYNKVFGGSATGEFDNKEAYLANAQAEANNSNSQNNNSNTNNNSNNNGSNNNTSNDNSNNNSNNNSNSNSSGGGFSGQAGNGPVVIPTGGQSASEGTQQQSAQPQAPQGPQTLDGVTINATDIKTNNMTADNFTANNVKGFTAGFNADQLNDLKRTVTESINKQTQDINRAINKANDSSNETIENLFDDLENENKKDNE